MEREDLIYREVRDFDMNLKACGRQLSASERAFLEAIIGQADSIDSEDAPEFARLVSSVRSCLLALTHSRADSTTLA
jgi:hypothetical protein